MYIHFTCAKEAEVSRLPYIHWLVRQLKGKLDEGELLLRSTSTLTGSALERVRKDSLEWAQLVIYIFTIVIRIYYGVATINILF